MNQVFNWRVPQAPSHHTNTNESENHAVNATVSRNGKNVAKASEPPATSMVKAKKTHKATAPTTTSETILVGPELAAKWLESNHHLNRNIIKESVAQFVRDMLNGRWIPGTQIRFSKDGTLIDGQHRLRAIIESGTAQEFVVTRGCPNDTIKNLDTGCKRTARQNMKMSGHESNNPQLSIVNLLNGLNQNMETSYRPKLSIDEYIERIAFLEPGLSIVVDKLVTSQRKGRKMSAGVTAACVVAYNAYPARVSIFLDQLASGENLAKGDPAHTLREHVAGLHEKFGEKARTSLFLRTCGAIWAHLHGNPLKRTRANVEAARYFVTHSGWIEKWTTSTDAAMGTTSGEFVLNPNKLPGRKSQQ